MRRGRVRGAAWLALALAGAAPASAEALRFPLTCTLRTTGVGQFHGSDYAAGPAGSLNTVTVAASPADLRLGRATLVEGNRAEVAELSVSPEQATLIGQDARSTTVLALFTAAPTEAGIPAAFFRGETIGSIPVMIQSTGLCRLAP